MAKKKTTSASPSNDSATNLGFEIKLWLTADKLRNNMDAAGYKNVVLGLIPLNFNSESFEELHKKLVAGEREHEGIMTILMTTVPRPSFGFRWKLAGSIFTTTPTSQPSAS